VQKRDKDSDCKQHIGISRGGRSTKIHAVVDGLGYPLVLEMTGGQVNDSIMFQKCLEQLNISKSTVLADKAYGSWNNREYLADHHADFCIPPKSNSSDPWYCDYYRYKERYLVENFFMRIKDNRRIAMRFDKLARRFMGFVFLAAALLWLA
jgi:transposase